MRKETNIRKNDFKLYVIVLVSITVMTSIGIIYYNLIKGSNEEIDIAQNSDIENSTVDNVLEEASVEIGKTVEELATEEDIEEDTVEKIAINTSIIEKTEKDEKRNIENEVESKLEKEVEEELSFGMPIDGEIIKEFAKDTLVYSATLNEWTTHTGIDIKAEKAAVVNASEKGIVKYIKNDPRYGITVVIEHGQGYSTIYSNLLTSEFVVEGESVEKGQTIGTVGNTAVFEIADESHLHFEILKDNIQVDPKSYLK